jgi:hypothetical protein
MGTGKVHFTEGSVAACRTSVYHKPFVGIFQSVLISGKILSWPFRTGHFVLEPIS